MTALARPDRDRPPVTAASLRIDLERAIRSRSLAANPAGAADVCLSVVLPHLRAMAGEIERLRSQVKSSSEGGGRRA